jgi:hypothetical protein
MKCFLVGFYLASAFARQYMAQVKAKDRESYLKDSNGSISMTGNRNDKYTHFKIETFKPRPGERGYRQRTGLITVSPEFEENEFLDISRRSNAAVLKDKKRAWRYIASRGGYLLRRINKCLSYNGSTLEMVRCRPNDPNQIFLFIFPSGESDFGRHDGDSYSSHDETDSDTDDPYYSRLGLRRGGRRGRRSARRTDGDNPTGKLFLGEDDDDDDDTEESMCTQGGECQAVHPVYINLKIGREEILSNEPVKVKETPAGGKRPTGTEEKKAEEKQAYRPTESRKEEPERRQPKEASSKPKVVEVDAKDGAPTHVVINPPARGEKERKEGKPKKKEKPKKEKEEKKKEKGRGKKESGTEDESEPKSIKDLTEFDVRDFFGSLLEANLGEAGERKTPSTKERSGLEKFMKKLVRSRSSLQPRGEGVSGLVDPNTMEQLKSRFALGSNIDGAPASDVIKALLQQSSNYGAANQQQPLCVPSSMAFGGRVPFYATPGLGQGGIEQGQQLILRC